MLKPRFFLIDAKEGVQEQSRRHGYILKLLGLTQVAVGINKMDPVGYEEKVYSKIKAEYSNFLESLGVEAREFIPVSAKLGTNIAELKNEMPPVQRTDCFKYADQFLEKAKTRSSPLFPFPVKGVYKFDERRIIAGRVESGKNQGRRPCYLFPSNKKAVVKTIESWSVPKNLMVQPLQNPSDSPWMNRFLLSVGTSAP
ncbi:MAG: hypothetical protein Ct9H300mP23_04970 [Nitrospinota bacterium]|nr:MAG: hypothetical protein Ct9H300mP23_04970 [Nitrospinota bacterium]